MILRELEKKKVFFPPSFFQAVLKFPPGVESLDVYVFESGLETTGVRLNYWLGHFQANEQTPRFPTF